MLLDALIVAADPEEMQERDTSAVNGAPDKPEGDTGVPVILYTEDNAAGVAVAGSASVFPEMVTRPAVVETVRTSPETRVADIVIPPNTVLPV